MTTHYSPAYGTGCTAMKKKPAPTPAPAPAPPKPTHSSWNYGPPAPTHGQLEHYKSQARQAILDSAKWSTELGTMKSYTDFINYADASRDPGLYHQRNVAYSYLDAYMKHMNQVMAEIDTKLKYAQNPEEIDYIVTSYSH